MGAAFSTDGMMMSMLRLSLAFDAPLAPGL
jgi:hypothetical protein